MSKQAKPFVHYRTYITSDNWYSKHLAWLKAVGYRCTMLPWIRIGKGRRYAIHHMNYKNLSNERLGRDVVPLSPFAHNFVIHGVLTWFKSAGKQGITQICYSEPCIFGAISVCGSRFYYYSQFYLRSLTQIFDKTI